MSTETPGPSAAHATTELGRSWGWVLAAGIAWFLAGLVTLVWPGVTILALVIILGVFLLFAGATELGWSFAARHNKGWGLLLFRGIVAAIPGMRGLAWPAPTALVL